MTAPGCPTCCRSITGPGICGNCGYDVPRQWLEETTLSIALTGARSAGKSILIAVMMEQFRYFLEQRHHTFLEPLGDTEGWFLDTYVKPLYGEGSMLKPTPKEPVIPLMWSFRYGNQRVCLALYDAAGEHFETLAPNDEGFAYLGNVDLLVSMIDPLKIEGIRAILDGQVTVPTGAGNDLSVLRLLLRARAAHAQRDKRQALAIVLSKFDVIQDLRHMNAAPWQSVMNRPGSAMMRDPSFVSLGEDAAETTRLEEELRSLLHAMKSHLLLSAANEAHIPHRLFAVSALGRPPSSGAVHRVGITPFRVIDILKSGLAFKGALV